MLDLQQVKTQPTKPSDIKETDLTPFECSTSIVWKWFRLNVIFVLNVILKMGLPVCMADNEGFRKCLAMLDP
jgi:hypothetical protein